MSRASVVLTRAGTNERTMLGPGDIIGRSEAAALHVDDPRISEAHAMVSLRECELKLIGLRGRFRHCGEFVRELTLAPGARVALAPDIELICEDVVLPDTLTGISIDEGSVITLVKTVSLSFTGASSALKAGFDPHAEAVFWPVGSGWRVRERGGSARTLSAGNVLVMGAHSVRALEVPIAQTSLARTRSRLRSPITFVTTPAFVRLDFVDAPPVRLSGVPGRILSSVLTRGGSATWEQIIEDVWPDDASARTSLRARFDTGLRRLRGALKGAIPGPDELLEMDGTGVLSARLGQEDRVERVP